jgi:hypothetical protein
MTFKKACRFLLLPSFLTALTVLLISWLIRWATDSLNLEINSGILTGWIPFLLGLSGYFLVIHHRLRLFFSKRYDNNYLFSLLAIVLISMPGVTFQIAYGNMKMQLREVKSLSEINPDAKNTVWKYSGQLHPGTMLYLGDYREYTSGKHPQIDFLCYGLVHFEQESLWILFSESEMIDNDESGSEQNRVFNKVHNACVAEVNKTLSGNTAKPIFLVPLEQSADLEYAYKTLSIYEHEGPEPKKIFEFETDFHTGLTIKHQWFLIIACSLNLLYFFIFCLFCGRVSSYEFHQTGTGILDLSPLIEIRMYILEAPVTAFLLFITLLFLFIEIAHDPNIFTVKEEPYILRWTISKSVWNTGEWYRLFTYPFVNIHLLLRIFDILIFAMCAFSIEKNTSSIGFGLLSFCVLIAGGLGAVLSDSPMNCGLTVFTLGYSSYYLFTGFQRKIGFSTWKFIGITLLVFGLFLGSITDFLEYPKLIAATLTGFAFGPFLKYRQTD